MSKMLQKPNTVNHSYTENCWTAKLAKPERNRNGFFVISLCLCYQTECKPKALVNNNG